MMPLLLSTVVIHAYHAHSTAYHHLFTLATVLSMCPDSLRWCKQWVGYLIFFWIVEVDTHKVAKGDKGWLLLFPISLMALRAFHYFFPSRHTLPALMGVVGIVGAHCYLRELGSAATE